MAMWRWPVDGAYILKHISLKRVDSVWPDIIECSFHGERSYEPCRQPVNQAHYE